MTLAASPPVIGVAQSPAAFSINHAVVPGSATILEGAAIQTRAAPSDVTLKTGERVRLAPNSAAVLYRDRMVLQAGLAEVTLAPLYRIDARDLSIGATDSGARVTVSVAGRNAVAVSTQNGNAEIRSSQGVLVARMHAGDQIRMQPAQTDAIQLTGVIRKKGDAFILEDQTTHVVVELRGGNFETLVGKTVHINGTVKPGATPSSGASQVVTVATSTVITTGTGGAPTGAAAAPGISTAATVAVIGGVAAAATAGGLAFAGTFSGSNPSVSR